MLAFGLTAARARTVAILAHLYLESGLRPALFRALRAFSCSFVRFLCVLKLEPLTFNPSVLGSNPRGPTTDFEARIAYFSKELSAISSF